MRSLKEQYNLPRVFKWNFWVHEITYVKIKKEKLCLFNYLSVNYNINLDIGYGKNHKEIIVK